MATRGVRVTMWAAGLSLALAALAFVAPHSQSALSPRLPAHISDQDFWHLIETFSEPNGYFRSDNFLSNETGFQRVIPALEKRVAAGGVYIGVGPEQNFTYIAALRPRLAFIIDIRRQNMIEHLMYKAFIEQSEDRADFLSRLFARPRPAGLDNSADADALFHAYSDAAPSRALFTTNLSAAREW